MISQAKIRSPGIQLKPLLCLICVSLLPGVAIAGGDIEDQSISATEPPLSPLIPRTNQQRDFGIPLSNHNEEESNDDESHLIPRSRSFSDLLWDNKVAIASNLDTYVYQALQHTNRESAAVVAVARTLNRASHQHKIQTEYEQLMKVTKVHADLLMDRFTWCPLTLDNNEDGACGMSWPSLRRLVTQTRSKTSKLWRGSFTGDDFWSYLVLVESGDIRCWSSRLSPLRQIFQNLENAPAEQLKSLQKIESLL